MLFVQSAYDLTEAGLPPRELQCGLDRLRRVRVIPGIEFRKARHFMLFPRCISRRSKISVDIPCGLLAVPDGDSDRALRRHHIAASEHSIVTGHHLWGNFDDAVNHSDSVHVVK